jgi:hypothetical protein
MDGTPRGADRPSIVTEWGKKRKCMILVDSPTSVEPLLLDGDKVKLWYQYDTYSQNPKLVLRVGQLDFSISVELMSTDMGVTILRKEWEAADVTKEVLPTRLAELKVKGVTPEDLAKITAFGSNGLSCFSIDLPAWDPYPR